MTQSRARGGRAAAETRRIGGRTIRLTNPDKVLYPRAGFTKRQVVDYYLAVAPYLPPPPKNCPRHLPRLLHRGRPLPPAASQELPRHPEALPGRHEGAVLLREGRAELHTPVGED